MPTIPITKEDILADSEPFIANTIKMIMRSKLEEIPQRSFSLFILNKYGQIYIIIFEQENLQAEYYWLFENR